MSELDGDAALERYPGAGLGGDPSARKDSWMPSVIRVPEDCDTVPQAVSRAVPGQTIRIAAGEHTWPGRIEVHKVLHIIGEKDEVNSLPLTVLNGRWLLCVPPPVKWDMNPITTGTFTNVRCQSVGGYCIQVTGMHWEFINSRILCHGGTALFVPHGHVTLEKSWVGGLKDTMVSNNGVVICNEAKVFMAQSALRNSKSGAYLRDSASLYMVDSEAHRVSVAFGCMLPNDCEMEVVTSRMNEIEVLWHQDSRPATLIQRGNYDLYGKPLFIHGDADGRHTFQTQDLQSR